MNALPILKLNVTAPGANLTKYLLTVPPPWQIRNRCPPSFPLPTHGSFGAKYTFGQNQNKPCVMKIVTGFKSVFSRFYGFSGKSYRSLPCFPTIHDFHDVWESKSGIYSIVGDESGSRNISIFPTDPILLQQLPKNDNTIILSSATLAAHFSQYPSSQRSKMTTHERRYISRRIATPSWNRLRILQNKAMMITKKHVYLKF